MCDVMRTVIELMGTVASPLPEHHRVCEGGGTRRDVHRCSSRKIQPSHLVGPPTRVPRPAGDGIVDDGGPDEHENDTGQHAPTLRDGTRSQGDSDGREHALIYGEEKIGDLVGADGGACKNVHEAEIREVTDEWAGRVGECQRIAPEEPLEAGDARGHDGEPYQREGRFASSKSGVEEAGGGIVLVGQEHPRTVWMPAGDAPKCNEIDKNSPNTRNHKQNKARGCNHPPNITGLDGQEGSALRVVCGRCSSCGRTCCHLSRVCGQRAKTCSRAQQKGRFAYLIPEVDIEF